MSGPYILVVDDDSHMTKLVAYLLKPLGVPVLQAKNGAEAIEYALSDQILLLIIDNCMPGLSGLETLESLRNTTIGKQIPCILLTGQDQTDLRSKAEKLSVLAYLTKPFSPTKLIEITKQTLEYKQINL